MTEGKPVIDDFLRPFFDNAGDLFCVLDNAEVFLAVNAAWERTTGRREADLLHTTIARSVLEADRSSLRSCLASARAGGSPAPLRVHLLGSPHDRPQSTELLIRTSAMPDGRPVFIMTGRTIPDHPSAAVIEEEDARYRRLVERSPEPAIVLVKGVIVLVNLAAVRLFKAPDMASLLNSDLDERLHEESRYAVSQSLRTLERDGRPTPLTEQRIHRFDGTVADVEIVAIPVQWGGAPAVHLLLHDISDRLSSEKALRISESNFRSVIENVSDAVYQSHPHGTLLFANPAMVRMLGYASEEDLLRVNARDLYVEGQQRTAMLHELDTRGRVQDFEVRLKRKDGSQIMCVANTRVVRTKGGEALYYEGTLRDVTDWQRIREELRQSEERYRQYFDMDFAGHFISKADGTMLMCNAAFARILGYGSIEEVLKLNAREFYTDPRIRDLRMHILKATGSLDAVESERRRKDGSVVKIIENIRATFAPDGSVEQLHGFIIDLTAQKQLEDQLREAQKMETLGTLAGGVAHDFNNLLAIIRGYADMIRRDGGISEKSAPHLAAIETAVDRGASTVRQLMAFARQDRTTTAPVDLNAVVKESLTLAKVMVPDRIRVETDLTAGLPPIMGDADQLSQVMINLINNARDAMPQGGVLRVMTERIDGDAARAIDSAAAASDYVHLVVVDEGQGMSEATRSRIFEPFFTTKGVGGGSGLGLAVVYGVVHGHEGFINVVSRPNDGTEFHIYIPASRDAIPAHPTPSSPVDPTGASETVLVIEDEPMLLDLLKVLLENSGYRVLTASDGEEALRTYREHMRSIDVVLSDMGLPKIGGWEVFQQMKGLNPRVRSILASGYLDQHLRSDLLEAGAKDFIQKPYIPEQILRRIREVISEPDPT